MKTVRVRLNERGYSIIVGPGAVKELPLRLPGHLGTHAFVVTNPFLKKAFYPAVESALASAGRAAAPAVVPDGERSKSIQWAGVLLEKLARYAAGKKVFLVALGGGVIGDLAGFTASVFKRGIPFVQIPTTLLAQVDSSIGGKTGVDLSSGKNLVGSFWQPSLVLSDTSTLSLLPERQKRAGLAEVIKYGLIQEPAIIELLEKNGPFRTGKAEAALFEEIVSRCAAIKARIVEKDEREERGVRTILNYGHTLGHALEAAGSYRQYNHGEAVAVGMLLAADLSVEMNLLEASLAERIERLVAAFGLPVGLPGKYIPGVLKSYQYDKKFEGRKSRFVLLEGLGRTRIVESVPVEAIRKVLIARSGK